MNVRFASTIVSFIASVCVFGGAFEAMASGWRQTLEKSVAEASAVFSAKLLSRKSDASKWGRLELRVEAKDSIKGVSPLKSGPSALLFQARPLSESLPGGGTAFSIVPQSGLEFEMNPGETWIFFFAPGAEPSKGGGLQIFRAEPLSTLDEIKALLKPK
jgi:hypothetical protein